MHIPTHSRKTHNVHTKCAEAIEVMNDVLYYCYDISNETSQ